MSSPSASRIDRVTGCWWFFLLLALVFFTPAYTTQPFDPAETPQLVIQVLSRPLAYSVPILFPIFKLLPLILIIGLVLRPKRASHLFYAWAGVNLLSVAIFQDIASTPSYGFAVLAGNLIIYGVVVLPALLAFWYPVSTAGGVPVPNFNPIGLLANEAGQTFCMMLPVYLAVLTLAYPEVDPTVLRVSAFVGVFTGPFNVVEFFLIPVYGPWMGTLHLPLWLFAQGCLKNSPELMSCSLSATQGK